MYRRGFYGEVGGYAWFVALCRYGRGTPSDFPAVDQSDSFDGSETWSPLYGLLSD